MLKDEALSHQGTIGACLGGFPSPDLAPSWNCYLAKTSPAAVAALSADREICSDFVGLQAGKVFQAARIAVVQVCYWTDIVCFELTDPVSRSQP